MREQKAKDIKSLKDQYVEYFKDVPIQKYAALSIGRDEDTVIRWRKSDREFADAVMRAKADWIRTKLIKTKAEFALERLESELFARRAEPLQVVHDPFREMPNEELDNFIGTVRKQIGKSKNSD